MQEESEDDLDDREETSSPMELDEFTVDQAKGHRGKSRCQVETFDAIIHH